MFDDLAIEDKEQGIQEEEVEDAEADLGELEGICMPKQKSATWNSTGIGSQATISNRHIGMFGDDDDLNEAATQEEEGRERAQTDDTESDLAEFERIYTPKQKSKRWNSIGIGHRLHMSNRHIGTKQRSLALVAVLLVTTLIAVFGLAALVIELGIKRHRTEWNTEKRFEEFENPYQDIIEGVIPPIQKWFRGLAVDDEKKPLLGHQSLHVPPAGSPSCLGSLYSELSSHVNQTSPAYVELILANMGLSKNLQIRKYLQAFLDDPQDISSVYDDSQACLAKMQGFPSLACTLKREASWNFSDPDQLHYLKFSVNLAVVVETLTPRLTTDLMAMHEVTEIMKNAQRHAREETITKVSQGATKDFRIAKYRGLVQHMEMLGRGLAENIQDPFVPGLQINILEAVEYDAHLGLEDNARVGLALASRVLFDSHVDGHRRTWALGQEWVSGYVTWNTAFVIATLPLYGLPKLLIPSTACLAVVDQAEDWIVARIISLSLVLMVNPDQPKRAIDVDRGAIDRFVLRTQEEVRPGADPEKLSIGNELGKTNLQQIRITSPPTFAVEEMLYKLCGKTCHDYVRRVSDSVPHARMNSFDFSVYAGFVLWITVMLTGLGMELLVWLLHLQDKWTAKEEDWWRFAQFAFSLLAAATLGLAATQNYMALVVLPIWLWKFGFPETWMYTYIGIFARHEQLSQRISDILNGTGLVVHHGAASFIICFLLVGVVPPTPEVLNPPMILIVQHWFALLKYANQWIYAIVELVVEFWFEWTMLSAFETYLSMHWTAPLAAATMLVAHWMFLLAACVKLLTRDDFTVAENVAQRIGNV